MVGLSALLVLALTITLVVVQNRATPGQQTASPTPGATATPGFATSVPADAVAITADLARNPLPAGTPGRGKPAVAIGSKNFSEQTVLGELYAQALRAKGFTVTVKPSTGGTELIDAAFRTGQIQLYPEYLGETVTTLARLPAPTSASGAYDAAKQWLEANRGATVTLQTAFQDTDAIAVTTATAQRYGLRTVADLAKIGATGSGVTVAGAAEFSARETGLAGVKRAYDLGGLGYLPTAPGSQYSALDQGSAQAAAVFSTDYQLSTGAYTVLEDPQAVFGFQHVAPIVRQDVVAQQGTEFVATLNWVSALLSDEAIQALNQQVQGNNQPPADVVAQFLAANGLA